jgi:tRNA-2-methylthio-N6-dimethylallyladenosine synthase
MNLHDSEKLAGSLEREGYVPATDPEQADVILLNTCSIREKAAEKVYSELGRLRRLKRKNPHLLLGVCGCLAQQEGRRVFARAEHVDFVLGPRATASLPSMLERLRAGARDARHAVDTEYRADSIRFPFDAIRREGSSSGKAYVTVIEGCNHRCTYCIVPTTRGREICRDMDDVLAEVAALAASGMREVEFLGQTVNAYRDAHGRTLAELLLSAAQIDGIERIRFTTSHPAQMTERLMDAMAAARPKLCPYLHLPVQSGSDAVLRAMRRGYDREGYLSKIDGLRRRMPDLRFGSDFIVGFPNEEETDFEQTLSLIEQVEFDTLYSFCYSPRPGTAALDLDDPIPHRVKLHRLRRLQALQKGIQERRNAYWVGKQVEVLVAGRSRRDPTKWTGRTPESRVVNFSGSSAPGRVERIGIRGSTAFALDGAPVNDGQGRTAQG